ncbi:MAG: hypothetical protein RL095_2381 [Verrucomicrobiota bacterium]
MRLIPLFLSLVLALSAAAEQPKSDRVPCESSSRIEASVSRIDAGEAPYTLGCAVARCEIRNGSDRDGVWKLEVSLGDANKNHENREIPVAAGASVTLDLPISYNVEGSNLSWSLRGPGIQSGGQTGNLYMSRYYGSGTQISVLASSDTSLSYRGRKSPGVSSSSSNDICLELEPRAWPSDWRGLCGFRKAALSSSEWLSLPAERQQALRDWVFAGGHLGFLPPHDSKVQEEFLKSESSGAYSGLGRISFLSSGALPDDHASPQAQQLGNFVGNSLNKQQEHLPLPEASLFFPCLILTLFAIAVGPLNLLVWAKDGRRHLLFITTPVISVVASLLLGIYILLMDGIGGSGRSNAVAFLDSRQQRMVLHQVNTSVTGLMPSRSGTLPSSALLSQNLDGTGRGDFALEFHGDGQQVFGDHLRSRSRQTQSLKRIISSRASIERLSDGGYRNSLPVAIRGGVFHHDGVLLCCGPCPPGARIELSPTTKHEAEKMIRDELEFKDAPDGSPANIGLSLPERHGSFALLCEPGEFVPQTFTQIEWKSAPLVILGEAQEARP